MDTTNNNSHKDKMKKFYEAFSAGNFNEFDNFMTSDVIEHSPDPAVKSDKTGAEYVKEICRTYKNAFPDLKIETQHMVEEGDNVIAHIKMTGTNTGQLGDMPATNKRVEVEGFDMIAFKGDKATEHWGVIDNLALFKQLGISGNAEGGARGNAPGGNK